MKLTFFCSHLAPKYFKVVANAKNLVATYFLNKPFLILFKIEHPELFNIYSRINLIQ